METIKDIAKACGVGVSTVSRAINNHPDINPETKQMILDVIKEHNYIPNNSARNLKRTKAKSVAVLIKGISNPFFSRMIEIIEHETQRKKYTFVLQRVEENEDELNVALQLAKEKKLKGIIFLGGMITHSEEKIRQLDVPFVLSTSGYLAGKGKDGKWNGNASWSFVTVDDYGESYKIVNYLCSLGHKRIAILAADIEDDSIGKLRYEGYKQALRDNGIEPCGELECHMDERVDNYSMQTGYRLMNKLLSMNKDFTAVYAIADSLAIGACRAIVENNKKIPEDYSVAGFDGLETGEFYNPSLTTIRQPVEKIAKETVELLFQIMQKGGSNRQIVLPGELVIRESTREV